MADFTYDLCVYGTSEAGIFAAIGAKRQGLARVCLVIDAQTLDNFSTMGLGRADIGKSRGLGGLYKTFARRTGNIYAYSISYPFASGDIEKLFCSWLGSWGVDVIRSQQVTSVQMTGTVITQLTMDTGMTIAAAQFIDGSLFGDVMQRALPRVAIADSTENGPRGWTIGSESDTAYGESLAGYGKTRPATTGQPYDSAGNLRNGATPAPNLPVGSAWDGIAAPGVRTMVTDDPSRMFPWSRITEDMVNPYNREDVLFAASLIGTSSPFTPNGVAQGKYDLNSIVIMTDPVTHRPTHWDYALLSYAGRDADDRKYLEFMRSRLFFTATDEAFAGAYQDSQNEYGTPRDEFFAGDRYTSRLPYRREGPRLIGEYVMCELDCRVTDTTQARHYLKPDAICLGTYSMDLKPIAYLPTSPTTILKEGDGENNPNRQVAPDGYQVPLRSILPAAAQCTNLLVVYCAGWTHIGWGSGRIICTNAMMGEAAGIVAALAIQSGNSIHSYATTNYPTLNTVLLGWSAKLVPTPRGDDDDDEDTDGDGIPDDIDDDDDNDGIPDTEDPDDDGDGVADGDEAGG